MAGPSDDTTFFTLNDVETEYAYNGDGYVIYNVGPNFYGNPGLFDGYLMDRPADGDGFHFKYDFTPLEGVDTEDSLKGSNDDPDYLYGGLGNDYLGGRGKADILVGGDGDDYFVADDGSDTIYGDWNNLPQVTDKDGNYTGPKTNSSDGPKYWLTVPFDPYDESTDSGFVEYPDGDFRNQDTSVSGDDEIYGGDGSDVIVAGPGNDQIDAGPHGVSGDPYTDDVNGGPGFDSFLLSYDESSSSSGGSNYWSTYGTSLIAASGNALVKNVTTGLIKASATDTLGAVGAGMLGGTVGGMAGALAGAGIEYLLNMGKAPKPKTNEDIMVVRDFNPSEDSLFLPFDPSEGKTLTAEVTFYASSAVNALNLTGWGIDFKLADTTYAEVFLDDNWLSAIGISQSSSSPLAPEAIESMLSTGILLTPDGYADTTTIDPFGSADPDPVPLTSADSGTYTQIWGAYMPVSIVQPASDNGFRIGGTQMGDLLSVNDVIFPPDEYEDFLDQGAVGTERSHIYGFGGNDVIFGGASQDVIDGGPGNDLIWSFDAGENAAGSLPETLIGNDGHDRMIALAGSQTLRGGTGSDVMDGGTDIDTADYSDITGNGVEVNLTTGLGYDSPSTLQQIGEFGRVSLSTSNESVTVTLQQSYDDPVIIFGPYAASGESSFGFPTTALLTSVSSDSFTVQGFTDSGGGTIGASSVDYIVVEAGAWELSDGTRLAAENLYVSNGTSSDVQFTTDYYTTYFENAPAVVTQAQTPLGDNLTTRNRDITNVTFDVALQEPDDPYSEKVSYLAMDRGATTVAGGLQIETGLTDTDVSKTATTLDFQTAFAATPYFFGTLSSDNDMDAAFLQKSAASTGSIGLSIGDYGGSTSRVAEQASYIALGTQAKTLSARVAPDRLFSIENVIGSPQDDMLTGNGLDNLFQGGTGGDQIDGMGGSNTASYADSASGVTVNLADSSENAGGSAAGDVLANIQNLVGSAYVDDLTGDAADNVLDGGVGPTDSLTGGAGNDTFVASTDGDEVADFAAGDLIDLSENWLDYNEFSQVDISGPTQQGSGYAYAIQLQSSAAQATLTVVTAKPYEWSAEDFILASADYAVRGTDGPDVLRAGPGDNTLNGFGEADVLYGGRGMDTILGGWGDDTLHGQRGDDSLNGQNGDDTILAGDGDDFVRGGRGGDTLLGQQGDDRIQGGPGGDDIHGGSGGDNLRGGSGSDSIHGGRGNDRIQGGPGADEVSGGGGDDVLAGNTLDAVRPDNAPDTFLFEGRFGGDVITDFEEGRDGIRMIGITADQVSFDVGPLDVRISVQVPGVPGLQSILVEGAASFFDPQAHIIYAEDNLMA